MISAACPKDATASASATSHHLLTASPVANTFAASSASAAASTPAFPNTTAQNQNETNDKSSGMSTHALTLMLTLPPLPPGAECKDNESDSTEAETDADDQLPPLDPTCDELPPAGPLALTRQTGYYRACTSRSHLLQQPLPALSLPLPVPLRPMPTAPIAAATTTLALPAPTACSSVSSSLSSSLSSSPCASPFRAHSLALSLPAPVVFAVGLDGDGACDFAIPLSPAPAPASPSPAASPSPLLLSASASPAQSAAGYLH